MDCCSHEGPSKGDAKFDIKKIADGVHVAVAAPAYKVNCNTAIIESDDGVVIVDTHSKPSAARLIVQELRGLTTKPVRYVVNTHFHYDHTDGNQVYAGKADIIGHEYVKQAIETLNVLQREPFKTSQLTNVPLRIEMLKKQIADAKDPSTRQMLGAAEGNQADSTERHLLDEEGPRSRRA